MWLRHFSLCATYWPRLRAFLRVDLGIFEKQMFFKWEIEKRRTAKFYNRTLIDGHSRLYLQLEYLRKNSLLADSWATDFIFCRFNPIKHGDKLPLKTNQRSNILQHTSTHNRTSSLTRWFIYSSPRYSNYRKNKLRPTSDKNVYVERKRTFREKSFTASSSRNVWLFWMCKFTTLSKIPFQITYRRKRYEFSYCQ